MSKITIPSHVEQKIKVTEPGFLTFLKISAELTGFSSEDLMGTGMTEIYYYTVMKEFDQNLVRGFFDKARDILNDSTTVLEKIRAELIPTPKDPKYPPQLEMLPFQGLAYRIILMWYTGIWTTMNGLPEQKFDKRTAMVSAEAYTRGLIWTVAETHPAGARQPGYASWNKKPLAI